MVESVLTLFIVGFAVQMVSALAFASAALREAEERSAVDAFLRDALAAASLAAPGSGDRVGDPIGFAYAIGRTAGDASGPARQGSGAMALVPADNPTSLGVSNVALLRASGPADADLEAYVRADTSASGAWEAGLTFGYRDVENHHRLVLGPSGLALKRVAGGQATEIAAKATEPSPGVWRRLRIVTAGHQLAAYLDGALAFSVTDAAFAPASAGLIGAGSVPIRVDDVRLASAAGSVALDFEGAPADAVASAFVDNAPYHLQDFRAIATVAPADAGLQTLKRVKVAATWTSKGRARALELETLKAAR